MTASEMRSTMGAERTPVDAWGWTFAAFGAFTLANAVWMLAAPEIWYRRLPAAVPDFGPFNVHFVRDIGCAYATAAAALFGCLRPGPRRVAAASIAAFFFVAHALLHVFDTARGHVDASHWWLDLPGVYAPALVLALAAVHFARVERGR